MTGEVARVRSKLLTRKEDRKEESSQRASFRGETPRGDSSQKDSTFLFTDIEGSTLLWEQYPEWMRQALSRHDEILRNVIEQNGGSVFDRPGDAFYAAFTDAADALGAALSAQLALLKEWGEERGLRVRMALHTGSAEKRGGNYYGRALNRNARLLSIGYGGQILLSGTTYQAVNQSLQEGLELLDLREHRLKDLQAPERVYQVIHPELPEEFPPLKSLSILRHNLPLQMTSFIGREKEMEELKQLLETKRQLTFTGAGGCGKTRLALQVGADLIDQYQDGVWLAELASLSDASLITQTVAAALGLREEPGRKISETLIDYLRPRSLLLVLDNCEHLIEPCAQLVDGLLKASVNLKVLATSRETLGISGETTWRVPSLSHPDPNRLEHLKRLNEYESVQLFLERAIAVNPAFKLTERNAKALAEICHRLDGIPLAIELAAARVNILSAEELSLRLEDRFKLLTGGVRTALPRHQTLRAAIDWSYDLLTGKERMLFHRLSVFSGGFTLEAAEVICSDENIRMGAVSAPLSDRDYLSEPGQSPEDTCRGGVSAPQTPELSSIAGNQDTRRGGSRTARPPCRGKRSNLPCEGSPFDETIEEADVLDLLSGLVNKSLIVVEELKTETRYRLLETIRDYALKKLSESGEEELVSAKHLQRFLSFAEKAEPELSGPDQALWLDRLELEQGNFGRALDYSLMSAKESCIRLSIALGRFWEVRGYWAGGTVWCERLLSDRDYFFRAKRGTSYLRRDYSSEYQEMPLELRSKVLTLSGRLLLRQGDYSKAVEYYEESLAIFRELGDKRGIAQSLNNLGNVAYLQGDYPKAREYCEESLEIYKELGDKGGIAISLNNLGNVAYSQGDYPKAREYHEESLEIRRELGDKGGIAISLNNLGLVADSQGDYSKAVEYYEESLAIKKELGDKRGIAASLNNLGLVAYDQGDYPKAREYHEESLEIRKELGDKSGIAASLNNLGLVAERQGDYPKAREYHEESLAIKKELGDKRGIAASLNNLGVVAEDQGDYSKAREYHEESLAIFRELGDKSDIAESLKGFAYLACEESEFVLSAKLFGAAEALRESISAPLPPSDREQYDLRVEKVRSSLGEERFASLWAEGRSRTLDEAVALALEM